MARSGNQEPHREVIEGDAVGSSESINANQCGNMNLDAELSLKIGRGTNNSGNVKEEKQKYGDEQQAVEALLQIKSVDLQAINNNNPVEPRNQHNNSKPEPEQMVYQKEEHNDSQGKSSLTPRESAMNQSPFIFHTSKYQDFNPGNATRNMTVDVKTESSPVDTQPSKRLGRHVCKYCGHRCAKPSVLTKHLRSHTGERPYPCTPCGFAFKTKSNLYKHCKSHAHAVKVGIKSSDSPHKGSNGEEDSEETESEDETKHYQKEEEGNLRGSSESMRTINSEQGHTSSSQALPQIIPPSQLEVNKSESSMNALKGHASYSSRKETAKLTEHSISKLLKETEQGNNISEIQGKGPPGIAGYQVNMESKELLPIQKSDVRSAHKGSDSDKVGGGSDQILIPLSKLNIVKTKGQYHLQLPMGTLPPEALASIQSRTKDPEDETESGNKDINDRIQKLISDNQEIINNTDLESVKPRKLGFDFREGEYSLEDGNVATTTEADKIEATVGMGKPTVSSGGVPVSRQLHLPESDKNIRHISLQHTHQFGSVFEMPQSQKKSLVPGPLNLSASGSKTPDGVSLKRKAEGGEEGTVFFSKKMKKTLYMPPDSATKKSSVETPRPAILNDLLTAPKSSQGQNVSTPNSLMFSSSLKKMASPFAAHGSVDTVPVIGSPSSSFGPTTSSCVPVIQHTPKSSESSSFSFISEPSKRKTPPNHQGLLRISTNAEERGGNADAQAALIRPNSLNLGGVRTVNSTYISKSERRRLSSKFIPTPKSGASPKGLASPRDAGLSHGMSSGEVPTIQLGSPRVRGGLPTADMWKKGAEKNLYQGLNVDVASPLAKMIKFPPLGSGGKPIIDPRVLLSPEALSIAESVMKKASPTNAQTPSTPVEQARELGRLVAHAFHNAGGNIESVLSTSAGNLIVGPIATPTSTGAKSQIFILPSPSSTQAPSFPGMSPSTPSKPFTPTGTSPMPFVMSGPSPKVVTPTGLPLKALTPTGPQHGFPHGFGSSKPLTPVGSMSKMFPTSIGPPSSVMQSPGTPGKMSTSFMQFPGKLSSPHPLPHRPHTPTTTGQRSVTPVVSYPKSLDPSLNKTEPSSSGNVSMTFPGSTTKVNSLNAGKPKPTLSSLKPMCVTPGNLQGMTNLSPGVIRGVTLKSPTTYPMNLKLTTPVSQAIVMSDVPINLSISAPSTEDDTKKSPRSQPPERKTSDDMRTNSQNFRNNMLTKGKGKLLGLVKNEQGQTLPTVPIFLYANMSARMCGVTKVTNCCSKRLQPMYAAQGLNSRVSMYSNWRSARHVQHPLGISWKVHLGLYNSHRNKKSKVYYSQCNFTPGGIYTESKDMKKSKEQQKKEKTSTGNKENRHHHRRREGSPRPNSSPTEGGDDLLQQTSPSLGSDASNVELSRIPLFPGGYESHEDYVYVRGRGRGKYVCMECGIRCKKPSMLKKHIRTHTDVRPYQCRGCSFSFKTKGNLTKHMKSKAHVKKCQEMGLPHGDIDLDSATDDMDDGDENQFADVDSEDTDSICSDNSDEDEDMDSEDSVRGTPSNFVESPFGVESTSQITRVGSCATSISAVADGELSPTLRALHQRMGLRRSLSEAQLTPSAMDSEDGEKDPAREQRLDELMGALKNRTMPPLNKPSRSEVVCKLTQHLTNKQQRNSIDGKLLPSPMKRSMSVSNLTSVSTALLRPSPSLPTVRPTPFDKNKPERGVLLPAGYLSSESVTKVTSGWSEFSSTSPTQPTMSKKSILTRRFGQTEGQEPTFSNLHIAPSTVNSQKDAHFGNTCKEPANLETTPKGSDNPLPKRSLLVPPPIVEPISDDDDDDDHDEENCKKQKLNQGKIVLGSQKFSLLSTPETSNAIKNLLLARAPVWPFPMEGIPSSPYSPVSFRHHRHC
ncbi:hypothetical protein BSL78_06046 [Apostichopus japonicus]|uniref:C2H2-type domain-containing protein n=1 Tax=Stichopus japonicus TaxID=307972 RepID=A0A2G8LA82_STIJA|nr:hypothetical protein BSL78_06046 [Apostichopus japonicus]